MRHFRTTKRGMDGEQGANEPCTADHGRTTPFSVDAYSLTTRRDGRSDVWCATWYDASARTLRHRSLRTRDESEAESRLAKFATDNPTMPNRRAVRQIPPALVYFIGGDVGCVKIGTASDPAVRLVALQCGSPIPLRILAIAEGGLPRERQYHHAFASHRLHGEWFERCPEILAEIERLNTVSITPKQEGPHG